MFARARPSGSFNCPPSLRVIAGRGACLALLFDRCQDRSEPIPQFRTTAMQQSMVAVVALHELDHGREHSDLVVRVGHQRPDGQCDLQLALRIVHGVEDGLGGIAAQQDPGTPHMVGINVWDGDARVAEVQPRGICLLAPGHGGEECLANQGVPGETVVDETEQLLRGVGVDVKDDESGCHAERSGREVGSDLVGQVVITDAGEKGNPAIHLDAL